MDILHSHLMRHLGRYNRQLSSTRSSRKSKGHPKVDGGGKVSMFPTPDSSSCDDEPQQTTRRGQVRVVVAAAAAAAVIMRTTSCCCQQQQQQQHSGDEDDGPDIYGQVHPEETPELIHSKLAEFDAEIKKLQTDQRHRQYYPNCTCLLQALEKCPELLTDDFKLQFLRCDVFHTKLAVKRYCKYWETRVELCGETAFEPQTLDQFTPQDLAALQDGLLQLVPGVKDPMGRALLYLSPARKDLTKYTRTNVLRACAYVTAAALESESVQQHGAVIFFDTQEGNFSDFDLQLDKMLITGIQGKLPMRLSAVHICHPQRCLRIILPLVKVFMPERMRKRIQIHKGNNEAILKRLQRYGLDKNVVPTLLGGNVELDHLAWIEERWARGL